MRLTLSRPRFTIEHLRTLVLVGGVLLVAAIVIFLAAGQWTRRLLSKDLPNRLGVNIEQQADGVNYTQTRKGKTIFKIHAARAVTMKTGGKTLLHDVKIDLYGDDGNRADTISGSEFEYDTNAGVATAAGAVEIIMMRPGEKPAITQLKPGSSKPRPSAAKPEAQKAPAANSALENEITDNQIHIKTSGLVFNQKTSVATTTQRVDFALRQGNGNSMGATYDSQHGQLILDRAVELHVDRVGGPITVHAGHAEFEHNQMVCRLSQAKADYTGGTAETANAVIHFRPDGSAIQLDGSGGVDLQTKTGGHVTAPLGTLQFDENNHPRHGLLQGGAHLEMNQPNRQVQGSSPTARLTFDNAGQLSAAHMEEGVLFSSQQQVTTVKGATADIHRTWKSQTADVAFAPAPEAHEPGSAANPPQTKGQAQNQTQAQSHIEPRTIHGYGGVVVTSESTSIGVVTPSKLSSDTMVAELAPGGALSSLQGTGHASFDERTAAGVHQASTADQLDVRFVPATAPKSETPAAPSKSLGTAGGSEIASMVEIGHVVLVQDPAPVHSGQAAQKSTLPEAQSGLRATANRADYDGPSQLLHLTGTPRVRDGAMDMTADRIDFARATGDAFAHGDVRASWIGGAAQQGAPSNASLPNASLPGSSLLGSGRPGSGGNDPVHAIASEAELHQASQEVIFRGAENSSNSSLTGHSGMQPRLWQSVNSVVAPVIVLNRQKMTLTAEAHGTANPVRTVLASNAPAPSSAKNAPGSANSKEKHEERSVIRVSSGDLHYSEGERLALFHGGSIGSVTAETTGTGGTATIVSQEAEVNLLPQGVRSASAVPQPTSASGSGNASGPAHSPANSSANSSIDRLTARGHVTVDWPDRRGTGEKLVYLSEDGTYTLTGTSSAPPRIVDQARGTVTGSALIYHSGDESVTVQGDGGKTETETRSKK
jgi:lipopolysaccharide export system protein LptA